MIKTTGAKVSTGKTNAYFKILKGFLCVLGVFAPFALKSLDFVLSFTGGMLFEVFFDLFANLIYFTTECLFQTNFNGDNTFHQ